MLDENTIRRVFILRSDDFFSQFILIFSSILLVVYPVFFWDECFKFEYTETVILCL